MLGGDDVYSGSKAGCEIIANSFRKSFFKNTNCKIATVRAGNCFGGGDWTKDRIVKDSLECFSKQKFNIKDARCNSTLATCNRTVIWLYFLAERLTSKKSGQFAKAWNFGPSTKQNMKVIDLVNLIKKQMQTNLEY